MSNTRNTGFLTNIIQYTPSGNISFVSGSTTLLFISSSGAITTTGVISGSTALSASNALSSSYSLVATTAATASSISNLNQNVQITGSLGVTSTITAQTLVVQTVTSSVVYSSGSNIFGNSISNTQTFTGSAFFTGSHTIQGNVNIGTQTGTQSKLNIFTSGAITGDNDALRLQVTSYLNGGRNSIVWGQDVGNTLLARFGLEWSVATSQMNFVWRDVYNNATGSTELMRLTGGGSLGIGTSNPASGRKLTVAGGAQFTYGDNSGASFNIVPGTNGQDGADFNLSYYTGTGYGPLTFTLGGSERMRITSSGTVIAYDNFSSYSGFRNYTGGVARGGMYTYASISGAGSDYSNTIFSETGLNIYFCTNGGVTRNMTITSAGAVLINNTSPLSGRISAATLQVTNEIYSRGANGGFFWEDRVNSTYWYGWYATGNTVIYLYSGTSGNIAQIAPSTGVYTAISDINKKKDIEESTIGLDAVMNLKPTLYRMKTEEETVEKHLGFIAQEVKDYIPQAYVETGEGDEKFIGVNDRAILAALTKAIQELKAENDSLKEILQRNNIQ